jgi:hypothetical protein
MWLPYCLVCKQHTLCCHKEGGVNVLFGKTEIHDMFKHAILESVTFNPHDEFLHELIFDFMQININFHTFHN